MTALLEPQSPILPDSLLLQRVAQRDSTALIELERRYQSSLYAYVYRVLMDADAAEAVVRDTFTQLWSEAERIGALSAWSWLREMAKELARAEVALRDPLYSTFVRRVDEADPDTRFGRGAAVHTRSANTSAEPPFVGRGKGESGGSDGSPRDACTW